MTKIVTTPQRFHDVLVEQGLAQAFTFTPFGQAVMAALDHHDTAVEIADHVGEPVCVVEAMLRHLESDGMVGSERSAKGRTTYDHTTRPPKRKSSARGKRTK